MTTSIAVIALCVATLVYVLWPLLRARSGSSRGPSALEGLEAPAGDAERNEGGRNAERAGR